MDLMHSEMTTVAAVSTPRGKGGIAVIRISGEDTAAIIKKVFCPIGKSPLTNPRYAAFGRICRPSGEVLDEGLCLFFPAPHSFTGEDVAEISCHGGALLTEAVLTAVLEAGARPAEAGEFTRRALLHGKMKLSCAEALGALLEAGTKSQLQVARSGMEGKLSAATEEIYGELVAILSDVYAKIDFPDEDLNDMSREELTAALLAVQGKIQKLARTWATGRAVCEGIKTVICGPVNAGKSSLYNALVGYEAAIVTDVAGTTRDILSEVVSVGDITLRLSDTAGLRTTEDSVEQIGIARADAALEEAELVLAVLDSSTAPDGETLSLLARLKALPTTVILVCNKQDKESVLSEEIRKGFTHVVSVSAKTGHIEELCTAIARLYTDGDLNLRHDAVVSNARQFAALSRADAALSFALTSLAEGFPLDAACVEIEGAMSAVGEVDGRAVDEDIVSSIFSHFCVGK